MRTHHEQGVKTGARIPSSSRSMPRPIAPSRETDVSAATSKYLCMLPSHSASPRSVLQDSPATTALYTPLQIATAATRNRSSVLRHGECCAPWEKRERCHGGRPKTTGLDYLSSSRTLTRAFKCRGWRAPSRNHSLQLRNHAQNAHGFRAAVRCAPSAAIITARPSPINTDDSPQGPRAKQAPSTCRLSAALLGCLIARRLTFGTGLYSVSCRAQRCPVFSAAAMAGMGVWDMMVWDFGCINSRWMAVTKLAGLPVRGSVARKVS